MNYSKSDSSKARHIHLSGKSDLPDYWSHPDASITMSFGRGPDGLISLTMNPASAPYPCYQLYSPHGDITILADSGGNPIAGARYDSFGNVIAGEAHLWYGYLGKYERYTDRVSGTLEMGVREYDPARGRFASADPLKGPAADPQQRNRYPYVGNNPLTRYDIDGRCWADENGNCIKKGLNRPWAEKRSETDVVNENAGDANNDITIAGMIGEAVPVTGEGAAIGDACSSGNPYICGAVVVGVGLYEGYQAYREGGGPSERYDRYYQDSKCSMSPPSGVHYRDDIFFNEKGGEGPSGVPNFDDPDASPGEGWEWHGNGEPGSSEGAWYNPETGESLHPDLGHADPVGPHYSGGRENLDTPISD